MNKSGIDHVEYFIRDHNDIDEFLYEYGSKLNSQNSQKVKITHKLVFRQNRLRFHRRNRKISPMEKKRKQI